MKRIAFAAAVAVALAASTLGAHAEYVCRLNPYGDNFLSLRNGPGGLYEEINRMGTNTVLFVLGSRGPWLQVRMTSGMVGWAHARYICGGFPR